MRMLQRLLALAFLLPALALAAPQDISREDLLARLSQPAGAPPVLLVDVRSAEEFAAGHLPGALNIPHDAIESRLGEFAGLARGKDVVLYCRSGRRTALAAEVLEKHGYTGLRHLDGDYAGWTAAGKAVEK